MRYWYPENRFRTIGAGGSLDDDARRRPACRARGARRPNRGCESDVVLRVHTVGFDGDDRASLVGGGTDLDVERDPAEIGNAARFRFLPCAALAEDRRDMVAGGAAE